MAAIQATGDAEELRGIGWGQTGNFTLASSGARGNFRRGAETYERDELKAQSGTVDFSVAGPGIHGKLSGSCGFEQETVGASAKVKRGVWIDASVLAAPYVYTCLFFRDAEPIGELSLERVPGRTMDIRTLRSGTVRTGGVPLALQSVHTFEGSRMPAEMPLGYTMARAADDRAGPELAAAYLNGNTRYLVLPRQPAEREAALLASLALALVWDPGDGE